MPSAIALGWIHAAVRIENQWGGTGTGFLVARNIDENRGKLFLVTNKHVIHEDAATRASATAVRCHVNTTGTPPTAVLDVAMRYPDGTAAYREHPDGDTDVLVIDFTSAHNTRSDLHLKWAGLADFADSKKIAELQISVAEEVMVIGYPMGMRQGGTNLPLVRQGVLATSPDGIVEDKVRDSSGAERDRRMKAFLVDGATIPGSSGSPVVLKPVLGRRIGDTIHMGEAAPVLLGIVAETRYAPIQTNTGVIPGFAGLGLAFRVEAITETIEAFFA